MKTKVWMFIIMFIPIMMSCGKENDSGGSGSSSSGSLSANGIRITQQEVPYGNATALVVTVVCNGSSMNYSNVMTSLQSYLNNMQNRSTVNYNGRNYSTEGHRYAAQMALQNLSTYSGGFNNYNNYNNNNYNSSCPASQLGQGVSLFY